ncbi:hypothetical protein CAEBREN_04868 [Caenorhabditis brenneri]|uniref:DUF38 domain-containing protein n=1 Tax=Caenorhabditis brenneri TaxID=135651 RepID=G0N308_CAEBE|nr:hypothetical protein CAEBREN_04868 [Caenorhabditis brenneri]
MLSYVKEGVLSKFFDELKSALMSLKHQIAVRRIDLLPEHPDNFLAILPYLKPGYLEEISIDDEAWGIWKSEENSRKVEQIMQLDQWKQAEELVLLDSLHLFPEEVLSQFKKYWIGVSSPSENKLAHIGLIFAGSPLFEHCHFEVWDPDFADLIDSIGVPGPPAEDYRSVRHLMIPNTDKMLVFKELPCGIIEIEKETRNVQ